MKSVVIIGSGNVATAMACAMAQGKSLKLKQICARNATAARRLAKRCGCAYAPLKGRLMLADLYVLAVSDDAVETLSASLKFPAGSVVAHTAGSVGVRELSSRIKDRAVLYPLQTFTKGRRLTFANIPVMIEGTTAAALECVREVAEAISGEVLEVSSQKRAQVHLAAVFACNFSNYMYTMGEELIADAGLPFDILKPLIRETALKAASAPSPRQVQTGPAARNDYKTKARHTEMLAQRPEFKNIYINLSKNIWETSKKI